ncbi:MAG: hypothetical protein Q9183_004533 [Haloplaca sp. 2 TL-2023]
MARLWVTLSLILSLAILTGMAQVSVTKDFQSMEMKPEDHCQGYADLNYPCWTPPDRHNRSGANGDNLRGITNRETGRRQNASSPNALAIRSRKSPGTTWEKSPKSLEPKRGPMSRSRRSKPRNSAKKPLNHTFTLGMELANKPKRRSFSDEEKERIKRVRRVGACKSCKEKKSKCNHVAISTIDETSPASQLTDDNDPTTPGIGQTHGTAQDLHGSNLDDFDLDGSILDPYLDFDSE